MFNEASSCCCTKQVEVRKKNDDSSSLNVIDKRFIRSSFMLFLMGLFFSKCHMWALWEHSEHSDLMKIQI